MTKEKGAHDRVQEPELTPGHHAIGDEQWTHPAFAQLSVTRVSANPGVVLYDSEFRHHNYVSVELHKSSLGRSSTRDWHFAEETIARIEMSEAQWATFVSSFNHGSGVPVTLRQFNGTIMPRLPLRVETNEARKEMNKHISAVERELRALQQEVKAELSGLSKAKREALVDRIETALREIGPNARFAAEQFEEHIEKTVEKGKVELHGYINATLQRGGRHRREGRSKMSKMEKEKYERFLVERIEGLQRQYQQAIAPYASELARLRAIDPPPILIFERSPNAEPRRMTVEELGKLANREDI